MKDEDENQGESPEALTAGAARRTEFLALAEKCAKFLTEATEGDWVFAVVIGHRTDMDLITLATNCPDSLKLLTHGMTQCYDQVLDETLMHRVNERVRGLMEALAARAMKTEGSA